MPNRDLDKQRQKGMHDREATQEERKHIQARRQEIEQRRKALSGSSNDAALKELIELQLEVVGLQEKIVELQLISDQQKKLFVDLKHRANGIWHDLSMHVEESQVRLETIQSFAETIQKLREDVLRQEEERGKKQRDK
ncbi:MAG: hypothetical protein IT342_25865 [Candidatus Melainabacteria bacterium]|jgi:hypothetical protein|nr:hypothetical protein [Candidatus Melainabacteria bacterium]